HVVEKADAGRDRRCAGAVEVDRDLDVGFLGGALDRALAHGFSASVNGERLVSGDRRLRYCSMKSCFPNARRLVSPFPRERAEGPRGGGTVCNGPPEHINQRDHTVPAACKIPPIRPSPGTAPRS